MYKGLEIFNIEAQLQSHQRKYDSNPKTTIFTIIHMDSTETFVTHALHNGCLRNWAANPVIHQYISGQPYTSQDITAWLSTAKEAYACPETYYWAIEERTSGEVIGEIYVDNFSSRNRWCELDWKIGCAFQDNGFATEAAQAIICYLVEQVGFHRIQAKCCVENIASERVMQKLGMVQEGILRRYFLDHEQHWQDVVLYSLIFEETSIR